MEFDVMGVARDGSGMAGEMTAKDRTRARILDEAASAMRERGSDGIGVAALMKRAGLTHGGFYAHFENRDDLVCHAVDRMFRDSAEILRQHLGQEDAARGLAALIDAYLSDELLQAADRGCPLPALSGEAMRMPAAARERFREGIVAFRGALAKTLATLGRPEPDALAASVLAEMVGAMAVARALGGDMAATQLAASREQIKRRLELAASDGGA
ncbi:TetR/AcrR family transcriptional regulator [Sphingomonas sp. 179-I 2A4 NHS]|uniref:TetR/AcrR family transcriptional regulator n=1 Tax=unclassified Sphingomonas TaxID=196159 RepID=UPI003879849E